MKRIQVTLANYGCIPRLGVLFHLSSTPVCQRALTMTKAINAIKKHSVNTQNPDALQTHNDANVPYILSALVGSHALHIK